MQGPDPGLLPVEARRTRRALTAGPRPRASNSAKPVDARVLRCKICSMAYELPKLPYAYAALAPHIDARTMEIHHTKHHQACAVEVAHGPSSNAAFAAATARLTSSAPASGTWAM